MTWPDISMDKQRAIWRLYGRMPNAKLAASLKLPQSTLTRYARAYGMLPASWIGWRPGSWERNHPTIPMYDDPTPEEIAERAAEIRAGWAAEEFARRNGAALGIFDVDETKHG